MLLPMPILVPVYDARFSLTGAVRITRKDVSVAGDLSSYEHARLHCLESSLAISTGETAALCIVVATDEVTVHYPPRGARRRYASLAECIIALGGFEEELFVAEGGTMLPAVGIVLSYNWDDGLCRLHSACCVSAGHVRVASRADSEDELLGLLLKARQKQVVAELHECRIVVQWVDGSLLSYAVGEKGPYLRQLG